MCDICKRVKCRPNCPNFEEEWQEKRRARCVRCGEKILRGDTYYSMHGFPYCETCLDFADVESLVRICEISKREWFEKMGFECAEA